VPRPVIHGGCEAALFRAGEDRIVGVDRVDAGGTEAAVPRDAFDSRRDEGIAFSGFDRMESDPCGLNTRRAEAIDRRSWDIVEPELHGNPTRHIAALLVTRLGTADKNVVQRARIQRRYLGQRGTDDAGGKIIRPNVFERSLAGASDRRTRGMLITTPDRGR
jgi:hypothetical protein